MPPKAKFLKEEIIQAALDLVREDGISNLTARALGTRLGSSARPIFTVFQNMDEVQQAVIKAAKSLYTGYIREGLSETPAFKGTGMQYILFSIHEPKPVSYTHLDVYKRQHICNTAMCNGSAYFLAKRID